MRRILEGSRRLSGSFKAVCRGMIRLAGIAAIGAFSVTMVVFMEVGGIVSAVIGWM